MISKPIWPNFNGTLEPITLVHPLFPTSRSATPTLITIAVHMALPMEWSLPKRSLEPDKEESKPKQDKKGSRSPKPPRGGGRPPRDTAASSQGFGQASSAVSPFAPTARAATREKTSNEDDNLLQMVGKLSLNTAQRNRELEGAVANCHEGPKEHELMLATNSAGKDYSAAVQGKGADHAYGPPHVHKFLAAVEFMSKIAWPVHMKAEPLQFKELLKDAKAANMGTLSEMCTMYKTKDTVEKKDKAPTTKIIWATRYRFSASVVDEDGVAADGRVSEVDLNLLMCKAFQQMKFEKSMSGPPPSVIEKKLSAALRVKK